MSDSEPIQSPVDAEELTNARKQLACQIISSAFEDLKLWAMPHTSYRAWMREEVQKENFKETAVFELYFFFIGWESETSALSTLIEQFDLDTRLQDVVPVVKPLLKEALIQFNGARESLGLVPWEELS